MTEKIDIKEVITDKDYFSFVKFPFSLYKNNPYWVPPLIKDEIETLNPNKNPVYKNSSAKLFLAFRENKLVGRIAAIINWIEINEVKKNKVRFGWFDVIDDVEVVL